MPTSLRTFLKAEHGVAAIEFVFILPFMVFLFFGMVDLTQLIGSNRKVTQSASIVADLVAQNRNTMIKSQINDYYKAVEMILAPMPTAEMRIEVRGFRPNAARTAVTQLWSTGNGMGPSCGAMPTTTSMVPLVEAGNDLIIARVCVEYEPFLATFMGKQILGDTNFLVEETIILRPRSTNTLTCYNTVVNGAVCS